MSTDFYEERKFKIAGAYLLAKAVREYHESDNRESLIHKVFLFWPFADKKWPRRLRTPVKHFEEEVDADEDVLMVNHRGSASPVSVDNEVEPIHDAARAAVNGDMEVGTPVQMDEPEEQVHQEQVRQEQVLPEHETHPTVSPSSPEIDDLPAIFDLPSDVIYATVSDLPKKDGSSLGQLPIYGPPTVTNEPYRNAIEEMSIVPISKFCLERYVIPVSRWQPPNKHYRHTTPEEMDEAPEISAEVQVESIPTFAPAGAGNNLASLLIKADSTLPYRRKSSAIMIRPPVPPTHYHEQKAQPWTPEEEQLLLQSAKENLYNFDLVASTLAFSGSSISDLEKRSAWECFKKYRTICPEAQNIQLMGPNRNVAVARLEKLDKRLSGGANRLKANAIVRQPRLDVRSHRYLNLFDAMKKSAKNREKQKQQGASFLHHI